MKKKTRHERVMKTKKIKHERVMMKKETKHERVMKKEKKQGVAKMSKRPNSFKEAFFLAAVAHVASYPSLCFFFSQELSGCRIPEARSSWRRFRPRKQHLQSSCQARSSRRLPAQHPDRPAPDRAEDTDRPINRRRGRERRREGGRERREKKQEKKTNKQKH